VNGTSGLPLTLDQSVVFGWVDRDITTGSEAVMVPYPVIRGDYWANAGYWWDLEFWNKSVDREAALPNQFSVTPPGSFPKIDPRFNPKTGLANFDVDSYVAQAQADVRFHVAGRFLDAQRGVAITFPDRPWRADWASYGLYPDGWTRPGVPARFRVFPEPHQRRPLVRTLHLMLQASGSDARPVKLVSNDSSWNARVTGPPPQQVTMSVCVPPHAPADVKLTALGSGQVEGDQSTAETFAMPRSAGILVVQATLDPPNPAATCSTSRGTRPGARPPSRARGPRS
jgi:hypothetical protein